MQDSSGSGHPGQHHLLAGQRAPMLLAVRSQPARAQHLQAPVAALRRTAPARTALTAGSALVSCKLTQQRRQQQQVMPRVI